MKDHEYNQIMLTLATIKFKLDKIIANTEKVKQEPETLAEMCVLNDHCNPDECKMCKHFKV